MSVIFRDGAVQRVQATRATAVPAARRVVVPAPAFGAVAGALGGVVAALAGDATLPGVGLGVFLAMGALYGTFNGVLIGVLLEG